MTEKTENPKVRYGVIGLGWISQMAVLPAFEHASKNSELVAIFSSDESKRDELSKKYKVPAFSYESFESGDHGVPMDAVYICTPNFLHCPQTIQAAKKRLHVLCEKPMAPTPSECREMIAACEQYQVKLMIAYRLHFEAANLEAIRIVQSGKIGEPKIFHSVFSMNVAKNNTRLQEGGGPLLDMGIYCINAARYLYQEEPTWVSGFFGISDDSKFVDVEEVVSATLRFPGDRMASFICSFGASDSSYYEILGTKGKVRLESAYEYEEERQAIITTNGKTQNRTFPKSDQFAPELLYFSECIQKNKLPELGGLEGLNDVSVVHALRLSARDDRFIPLNLRRKHYASPHQVIKVPPIKEPKVVHAESPHEKASA